MKVMSALPFYIIQAREELEMPNHVMNVIRFTGDPTDIKYMLEMIQDDELGLGSIDFNKLIPMPDSLHIESGSNTTKGYKYYQEFVRKMMHDNNVERITDLSISPNDEQQYLQEHTEIEKEVWNLGKAAYINEYLYGTQTWYEWSVAHWGTKWNAYGYDDSIEYSDDTIRFNTAWSAPHPVIEEIANQYPNIRIDHIWADEDIGANCGFRVYENGELVSESFPKTRVQGVEFACDVWGYNPKDIDLYLNASETNYIYLYDKLEIAHLDGKEILFSTDCYTDEDIPKGLFAYHLRENLDKDPMSYIEKNVKNDFAASIITREELDLGAEGCIALIPSEHIRFSDQMIEISDFLNGDMDQCVDVCPYEESGIDPSM